MQLQHRTHKTKCRSQMAKQTQDSHITTQTMLTKLPMQLQQRSHNTHCKPQNPKSETAQTTLIQIELVPSCCLQAQRPEDSSKEAHADCMQTLVMQLKQRTHNRNCRPHNPSVETAQIAMLQCEEKSSCCLQALSPEDSSINERDNDAQREAISFRRGREKLALNFF